MNIKRILAREVYNSRGWPTIACEIELEDGHRVSASVPTGLSRGSYEAKTMHDGGARLWGRGVRMAVELIEKQIAPLFVGKPPHAITMDLQLIELDGTSDKSNIGANTMIAVSEALYRAHAYIEKVELFEFIGHVCGAESVALPFPLFNMINGGMHAHNNLTIQEFLVIPAETADFQTSMEAGVVIFQEIGSVLKQKNKTLFLGDEGGFAPSFDDDEEVLELISEVLLKVYANYGFKALCALDVAASRLYDPLQQTYTFGKNVFTSLQLVDYYESLVTKYPICSIEDGFAEDDWDGWKMFTAKLGDRIQIVGDDLFTTHLDRIEHGIAEKSANAVLIKPDQIGTITETLQAIQYAREHGLATVVSHRSGETEDSFIADLAVGSNAGQIKTGGLNRSERLVKYNRLLTIEDHLKRGILK